MAMSAGLKNDVGCALRSGVPVEPAVSALLSSKGDGEREVARMALNTHCFPTAIPYDQWPVIQKFSQAHDPSGLEVFARELADTSAELMPRDDKAPLYVPRGELVARFIGERLAPTNQELQFSFEDPPKKRMASVVAAKKWVSKQIAEMKRAEKSRGYTTR